MSKNPAAIYDSVSFTTNFLMKEDLPNIFRSSFSIKNFPLAKRLDLFAVVEPNKKILLFDLGKEVLCGTEGLDCLVENYHVPWSSVEIVLSHFHDDHDGCLQYCVEKGVTKIYHGPRIPYSEKNKEAFLRRSGTLRQGDVGLEEYVDFFLQKDRFPSEVEVLLQEVHEGHVFSIAGYNFKVAYTPGHTPEHISLYEPDKKILFAGDFVLEASPGVMQFIPEAHLLDRYLKALHWAYDEKFSALYMSHRDSLFDSNEINTLISKQIASYQHPLDKVMSQFSEGEWLDAYEVAQRYCSTYKGGLAGLVGDPRIRKVSNMYGYLDYLYEKGHLKHDISSDCRDMYALP